MLRSKFLVVISIFVLFLGGATKLAAQEVFMADKVVAVVGNSVILYSEIDQMARSMAEQRKQEGYTSDREPKSEALEALVIQKLLYNQAQVDSLTIDAADIISTVQMAIDNEVANRGSISAVEMYYHKPIFDVREDLRVRYEESRYANEMERTIKMPVKVTPGEVEAFYKRIHKDSLPVIPEQYIFSQIVRFPPSLEEAKIRTRERLLEMRERIMNGDKFDVLARIYSEDPGTAMRGGAMEQAKEGLVKPFADALVRLKKDQVSEVVETEFGFHIIQMLDLKGNVYSFRHILLRPKFTNIEIQASLLKLDSIRTEIIAGNITFEKAAIEFSQDKYSKLNGGVATNIEELETYGMGDAREASIEFFKENLKPEDFQIMRLLKIGEVSKSFAAKDLRGNDLAKLIKINEIIPSHKANLKDDFLEVEAITLNQKRDKVFKEWLIGKLDGMYIRIDPAFRDGEYEYPIVK